MDSQLKRGLIEGCVLAAVCERESYGYLIIRDVPAALELTESTLYPVLKRLEKAGCVAVRSAEHNGRLRKYYRITDVGRARLAELAAERVQLREIYDYIEGRLLVPVGDGVAREPAPAGDGVAQPPAPAGDGVAQPPLSADDVVARESADRRVAREPTEASVPCLVERDASVTYELPVYAFAEGAPPAFEVAGAT